MISGRPSFLDGRKLASILLDEPRQFSVLIFLVALLVWLLGSYLLLAAGASYSTAWLNDQFGLVSIAYRVAEGQTPSQDFRSIYGVFAFLPPAAALKLGFAPGLALPAGHVIVTALLGIVAAAALWNRYGLALSTLVLVAMESLALAPVVMGKSPLALMSFGVYYNRHGWAFLAVAFLFFVDPFKTRFRQIIVDGLVLAAIVLFLTYSIFNFAVIAIAFLAANSFTSQHKAKVGVLTAAFVILGASAIELMLPGYHGAYFEQLFPAAGPLTQSTPGEYRIRTALLHRGLTEAALCGAAAFICIWATGRWVLVSGYIGAALLACVVLSTQTGSGTTGMPALIGVLASLAEMARRSLQGRPWPNNVSAAVTAMVIGIVVAAAAQPTSHQLFGLLYHFQSASVLHPEQASLDPPVTLASFRVGDWRPDPVAASLGYEGPSGMLTADIREASQQPLSTGTYYATIVEGTKLLKPWVNKSSRVLVFDMVDPFTFALGLTPTCEGIPLFWLSRVRDPARLPLATEVFADADFVMVPKAPYTQTQLETMQLHYGDYLRRHFVVVASSARWDLWRRSVAASALCLRATAIRS